MASKDFGVELEQDLEQSLSSVETNPSLPIQVSSATASPPQSFDNTPSIDVNEFINQCIQRGVLQLRTIQDQSTFILGPGREVVMELRDEGVTTSEGIQADLLISANELSTGEGWGTTIEYRDGSIILKLQVSSMAELNKLKSDIQSGHFRSKWSAWCLEKVTEIRSLGAIHSVKVNMDDSKVDLIEKFLSRDVLEERIKIVYCQKEKRWFWTPDQDQTWNSSDCFVVQEGKHKGKRPKPEDVKTLASIAKYFIEKPFSKADQEGSQEENRVTPSMQQCPICNFKLSHTTATEGSQNLLPNELEVTLRWESGIDLEAKVGETLFDILTKLGLKDKYPGKISLTDIMGCHYDFDCDHSFKSFEQLPYEMLKRLMSLDYCFRDETCAEFSAMHTTTEQINEPSFFESTFSEQTEADNWYLHPQDVLQVVYMCCSPTLRQAMAMKAFMCKIATPLILQKEGMLEVDFIAHKGTVFQWYENDLSRESDILSLDFKMVSFMRLGQRTSSFSKSQVLNQLLFDDAHSAFFTRHCHLGDIERQVACGTVESLWYLPTGNRQRFIESPVLFTNLRGSAFEYETQSKFLIQCSAVVVLFLSTDEIHMLPKLLDCLHGSNKGYPSFVFLLESGSLGLKDAQDKFKELFPDRSQIDVMLLFKSRTGAPENEKNIREGLGIKLKHMCKNRPNFRCENFENLFSIRDEYCCFDPDLEYIKSGFRLLEEDVENLETSDSSETSGTPDRARETLQLFWKRWAACQRDALRVQGSEEYVKYENEMRQIRSDQIEFINNQSLAYSSYMFQIYDSIKSIVKNVAIDYAESSIEKLLLYINHLDINTGKLARKLHPKLINMYKVSLEVAKVTKDKLKNLESTMAKLPSSGTQQFMRDMGQLYSCHIANIDPPIKHVRKGDFESFPDIAAELVFRGVTLEIMDGDAFSIPLEWMDAVFDSLAKRINTNKLLVISVVGVQSSGKSTLLNAMFGLQFAVSPGRCTMGVYAKLMKINIASLLYDYIMVVDTEGLRAMTVEQHSHDNELATLAIGMGDLTIINIKGENYTDMKDILQITVHAFLRLKLVKQHRHEQRKCMFVHQNVAAPDASDKMMTDRGALREALNKATQEAAELEKVYTYTKFDEIMEFDWQHDVFQFSDLWKGDPPMAPANPGYSKGIWKMKRRLYELSRDKEFIPIEYLKCRIRDLWEGILSDNFVFRFRNSLEIAAHYALDEKTRVLTINLHDKAESLAKKKISEELKKCKTKEEIIEVAEAVSLTIMRELEQYIDDLEFDLQSFCDQHPLLQNISPSWKMTESFKVRKTVADIIEAEKNDRIFYVELENTSGPLIKLLQMKGKDLGRRSKMEGFLITDTLLKEEFGEFWAHALHESVEPTQKEIVESIRSDVENVLYSCFRGIEESELKEQLRKGPFNNLPNWDNLHGTYGAHNGLPIVIPNRDITLKHGRFQAKDKGVLKEVGQVIEESLDSVDNQIRGIMKKDMKTASWVLEANNIITTVRERLTRHNNQSRKSYTFTAYCKVRLCIYACAFAITKFQEKAKMISDKYGKKAIMEKFRDKLYNYFVSIIKGVTDWELMKSIVLEMLETSHKMTITSALSRHFIEERETNYEKAIGLKIEVIKNLLSGKSDFKSFIRFIHKPKDAALDFLVCTIRESYAKAVEDIVLEVKGKFIAILESMNNEWKGDSYLFSKWLSSVECKAKKCDLILSDQIFDQLNDEILDVSRFTNDIIIQVGHFGDKLESEFLENSEIHVKGVAAMLLERFWGCESLCPFCNAPCTRLNHSTSLKFSKHESHVHRPLSLFGICRGSLENPLFNTNCVGLQWPKHRQRNIPLVRLIPSDDGSEADCCVHAYEDDDHDDWDIRGFKHYKMWNWLLFKYKDEIEKYYGQTVQVEDAWDYKQHEIKRFIENLSVMSYMKDTN